MKRTFYMSVISTKRLFLLFLSTVFMFGVTANAQTYTITFQDPPPASSDPLADQNDGVLNAIETGIKFYVTQPGTITGIRYFRGDGVLGTHIGHLWTSTGTQVASATFAPSGPGVGTGGWKEVAVSVHIPANTVYVASVFSAVGDYASQLFGSFNWQTSGTPGVDFGTNPIRIPRTPNPGPPTDPTGNGLYIYLANPTTGAFPTNVNSNNFWIDVRFLPDFLLPVTITDFKAITANNNILVNWKTESESNNDGFEIQRSNNGIDWYAINFVKGAGQSSTVKNYGYTDKSLAPGLYYYRLKQIDFDGKSKNTAIVTASVSGKGNVSLFQNTPNPFSTTTTIRFDLPKAQKIKLSVFDMAGREIKVLTDKTSEAGSHLVTLEAATLSRQLYLVKLQTEDGVLTKTILVQ
jgi:Domain of unknown function (DUF4082)/Secretion system C-terminal sorting domain